MPPCGGHQAGFSQGRRVLTVSSRAPVWGASCFQYKEETYQRVSSRAPVWGASLTLGWISIIWGFQVVPPCGGHHKGLALAFISSEFQVVPPCGGHLQIPPFAAIQEKVSSRAPVWGASSELRKLIPVCFVSSRAPVWGASGGLALGGSTANVSSRAPVWGASWPFDMVIFDERFQVVPPCGGHLASSVSQGATSMFQVVPPCGGHPHVRKCFASNDIVSSRAPVWGASCAKYPDLDFPVSFKSCPRVGGIADVFVCLQQSGVSSRAPVWGASTGMLTSWTTASFKSCPRVGGIKYC